MILGNMLYFVGLMYTYDSNSTLGNTGSIDTTADTIGGCSGIGQVPRGDVPNGGSGDKTLAVTITINGIKIRIYVSPNGWGTAETDDPRGADIVKGLNNGFNWLKGQGYRFSVEEMQKLGTKLENFYNANYTKFSGIFDDKTQALSEFFEHAVIGWAVAQKMSVMGWDTNPKKTGYTEQDLNFMIGFWVSFWASRSQAKGGIGLYTQEGGALGLIDVSEIVKAIIAQENTGWSFKGGKLWHDNAGDSVAFGLMQVYKDFPTYAGKAWIFRGLRNFANVNWKSDVFLNIGAGVGELFMKAQEMGILDKGFGLGDWARVTANYFGSGQDTWWYTAFVFGKYFWRLKGKQAIGFYSFDNLLDTALGALGTNRAKTYEHLKRFCREHPPLTEKDAIEGWKTLVDRSW